MENICREKLEFSLILKYFYDFGFFFSVLWFFLSIFDGFGGGLVVLLSHPVLDDRKNFQINYTLGML